MKHLISNELIGVNFPPRRDNEAYVSSVGPSSWRIGTFRSDYEYEYEYEYEFFNVYPVRMPDCVRLSRQLVLSSKSRSRLDTNYEIINKSRPPTTAKKIYLCCNCSSVGCLKCVQFHN